MQFKINASFDCFQVTLFYLSLYNQCIYLLMKDKNQLSEK